MKRKKTMLVLGLVLVAAVAAIIGVKAIEKHVDKVNTIDEEVFTLDSSSVIGIEIDYEGSTVNFTKDEDTWIDADDENFPIDQDSIEDLIDKFESVHASFIINDVEDYSQYGLKAPTAEIKFTDADTEKKISFGSFSTMDSKRYICVDDKSVYLIDTDLLEDISSDRDDYMANKEIPDFEQITKVVASGASSFTAIYEPDESHSYSEDYDYYLVNKEEYKPIDGDELENYVSSIKNMDTSNYVTYQANDEELSKYGLDSPSLTITVTGDVLKEESDDTESKEITINFSSVDDEKYYARVGESSIIYNIDEDTYKKLVDGKYETLRPSELLAIDFSKAESIVCKLEGESFTVNVDDSVFDSDGLKYNVDGEDIDFQTAVDKIKLLSLSEAGSDYSVGQEELQFTIALKDENETKLNIILYRFDGDSCVAKVNDEVVGLVTRDSMSNLREAMLSAKLNIGKTTEENN